MTIKKAIENCNGNFFDWNEYLVKGRLSNKGSTIQSVTADELMNLQLEPLVPIVENLLYPGFSILAGAPKVGKSWFCLDLGISVANGTPFLMHNTNKSECLYLALEDSPNRLQSRLKSILGFDQKAPKGFHIATSCNSLDNGLIDELQNKVEENPNINLIIVDTLQKVRGAQVRGETWYASDYKEIAKLKKFADTNKICILAIHHLRKQKDTDVFNQISGSTGITGAADTMIVLGKLSGGNGEVMMSVTGRDVDFTETVLKFDKNIYKWQVSSQFGIFGDYQQQLEYRKNPIVITIKKLVADNPEGISLTATDLLKKIFEVTGSLTKQDKPQTLSRIINEKLQFSLWKWDKIFYEAPNPNGGSSGRKLFFSKQSEENNEPEVVDTEFVVAAESETNIAEGISENIVTTDEPV